MKAVSGTLPIMRTSFCMTFLFIFIITFSQEKADSSKTKTKLKAAASVSLNSNGIASIPAFSLGKPAIIGAFSLTKNRFSFDPVLAYNLEMKPWFIDSWLHYKIVNKPAFELRTGFNFSTFFSEYKLPDETLLQGQRYFALALEAMYKISPTSSLTFMYWRDMGQEPGTISGHFFNLVCDRSDIKIGKSVVMAVNVLLFAINYDGNNDGLFMSPKISFAVRNIPLELFWQATQVLDSNISPNPGFKWNIGLAYTL
jgi:hypothetical protein